MSIFAYGRGHRPLPKMALLGAALALPLAACDTEGLLDVDDPSVATPESLEDPGALPTLVAGALGDFQIAYSGSGGDAFLSVVSLITDEVIDSETFPTRIAVDRRDLLPTASGNTSDVAFVRLQRARRATKDAAASVAAVAGATDPRVALLKSLEAYTYVALGEGFCEPVPFSDVVDGVRQEGPPLSRTEMFAAAIARFDEALAVDAGYNLAKVGKARALLNNGEFDAAAAAVAGVPTEFAHFVEHSSNTDRQYNPIFSLQLNGRYSVSNDEGINGLLFRESGDPRIPWVLTGPGFDGTTPVYFSMRYPSRDADVPFAGGIEARLIEAEVALRNGQTGIWLSILNDLRANVETLMAARFENYAAQVPGPNNPTTMLAPLTDPGTPEARLDLMFRERGFWLYMTGHRLGDLRRLIRQYGRTQDEVFPVGAYHKGGEYGNDVNFPVPFDEANNSLYDISSCSTTTA